MIFFNLKLQGPVILTNRGEWGMEGGGGRGAGGQELGVVGWGVYWGPDNRGWEAEFSSWWELPNFLPLSVILFL